ncbi:winged helix-turn-helix transcriptional regulator [Streptomyces sp. 7-21]|nr:winged helix-turn-helix transcriptional regulator [Streptomyces sp. 7-21]
MQRPGALYRQVAAAIRRSIASGEYEPGSLLPSEAQLIARYQVSRPTVRNAISALRAEGLIEVSHGKGSFVRSAPTALATVDRTVTRSPEGTFHIGHKEWKLHEPLAVHRIHTTAETGRLLGLATRPARSTMRLPVCASPWRGPTGDSKRSSLSKPSSSRPRCRRNAKSSSGTPIARSIRTAVRPNTGSRSSPSSSGTASACRSRSTALSSPYVASRSPSLIRYQNVTGWPSTTSGCSTSSSTRAAGKPTLSSQRETRTSLRTAGR